MNLFENLQIMKESENPLITEFKEFLKSKNAQYIPNELGETKDGMQIVIYDGDWKHEHLYMKYLLDEFFKNKGIDISITSEEIGESYQDSYSAQYDITFNAKPKTYTTDVTPLKFTTEDVKDSFDNDGLVTELKTGIGPHNEERFEIYQNGTLMFHTTDEELAKNKFKEISKRVPKEYKKVDGKYKKFSGNADLIFAWENIDTSNWKPRFKGMDIFTSDKYPNYQINKTYNGFGKELWAVLKFDKINVEGKRVFIGNTFEQAIDFIENGKSLKKSNTLDNLEESKKEEWEYWEMPKDYNGAFTYPYYIKEYDNGLTAYIYPPYKSDNENVKSHNSYVTELYNNETGETLNAKTFTDFETAKNWSDNMVAKRDETLLKEKSESNDTDLSKDLDDMLLPKRESNHNEILDRDYKTGEKLFNELLSYLQSLDQVDMDGEDYNWQPSEFNAKNLNADGEIYLVSGTYILIYPYINEWSDEEFRVIVQDSDEMSIMIKNAIERIFNKHKNDKWRLIFQ